MLHVRRSWPRMLALCGGAAIIAVGAFAHAAPPIERVQPDGVRVRVSAAEAARIRALLDAGRASRGRAYAPPGVSVRLASDEREITEAPRSAQRDQRYAPPTPEQVRDWVAPTFDAPLYGGGYGGVVVLPGGTGVDPFIGRAEYFQRLDRSNWNTHDMNQRATRLYRNQDRALAVGLAALRAGEYDRAVIGFRLAAELDHGDPACRIHLAHALMATGQYEDAGRALRRALSLQPKAVFTPFDLAADDVSDAAFAAHVADLQAYVNSGRARGDACFLLGFVAFQEGRYEVARAAFVEASRRGRSDDALGRYLELTAQVGG